MADLRLFSDWLIYAFHYYAFPTGSVYMDLVENRGGGGGRQEIEEPQGM